MQILRLCARQKVQRCEVAGEKVYTWYASTFDEGTQLQCKIRVMMAGDVIGTYDFEGNNGMCGRYAAKLRS
jgi:hypothetical protein